MAFSETVPINVLSKIASPEVDDRRDACFNIIPQDYES